MVMMDSASLANSRELKGRTLTATFTPDICRRGLLKMFETVFYDPQLGPRHGLTKSL